MTQDSLSKLDSKFSEEIAGQDERMAVEHAHFSDLCKSLDGRLTEETVTLDEKFTDTCASLDKQLKDKTTDLKAKVDAEHKNLADLCRKLEKKISGALASFVLIPVLSCPVLSCPVLSCPVLSCPCDAAAWASAT
jgi:hypothetical protein